MSSPQSNVSPTLSGVLAEYLEAVDGGATPDRQALLTAHPELADDLRAFFADHDRMSEAAAPVRKEEGGTLEEEEKKRDTFPQSFGDYELLEEIGRGGMGVVYKARQLSLNRVVALKRIRAGQLASAEDIARFQREAKAAAGLDHPHIVPIYEVGEQEGQHYFTMKLIEGGNLNAHLSKYANDAKATAQVMIQVARAVHHAHQRGILHRDLKPGNILIDSVGNPHVSDFGLAQPIEREAKLTQSGAIVGTPEYMAPEQARGEKGLTTAADVYGLGAILYVLLTRKAPFQGDYTWQTLKMVVEEDPVLPRSINRKADRDLETVALKCLAKQTSQRYGSADALADELQRWMDYKPIVARPEGLIGRSAKWGRRHPVASVAIVAIVILGVVLLGGRAFHRNEIKKVEDVQTGLRADLDRFQTKYLLAPVGHPTRYLRATERDALLELASLKNDTVRRECLKHAIETSELSERLRHRPEMVVRAVVGLSSRKRREYLHLLDKYKGLYLGAVLTVELGSADPAVLRAATEEYLEMYRDNPDARHHLAKAKELVGRLTPWAKGSLAQTLAFHIRKLTARDHESLPGMLELFDTVIKDVPDVVAGSILRDQVKRHVELREFDFDHERTKRGSSELLLKVLPRANLARRVDSFGHWLKTLPHTRFPSSSRYYRDGYWQREREAFLKSLEVVRGEEKEQAAEVAFSLRSLLPELFDKWRGGYDLPLDPSTPWIIPPHLIQWLDAEGIDTAVQEVSSGLSQLYSPYFGASFYVSTHDKRVMVGTVFSDTPAHAARLMVGDEVLLLDKTAINDVPPLLAQLRKHRPGDKVAVKIKRGSAGERDIEVTLGERSVGDFEKKYHAALARTLMDLSPLLNAEARSKLRETLARGAGKPHFRATNERLLLELGADPLPLAEAHLKTLRSQEPKADFWSLLDAFAAFIQTTRSLQAVTSHFKDADQARSIATQLQALMEASAGLEERNLLCGAALPLLKHLPAAARADVALGSFDLLLGLRHRHQHISSLYPVQVNAQELAKVIGEHGDRDRAERAVQLLADFVEHHEIEKTYYFPGPMLQALAKGPARESAIRLANRHARRMLDLPLDGNWPLSKPLSAEIAELVDQETVDAIAASIVKELQVPRDPRLTHQIYRLTFLLRPYYNRMTAEPKRALIEFLLIRWDHSDVVELAKSLDSGTARSILERIVPNRSGPRVSFRGGPLSFDGINAVIARLNDADREAVAPAFLKDPFFLEPKWDASAQKFNSSSHLAPEMFSVMLKAMPKDVGRQEAKAILAKLTETRPDLLSEKYAALLDLTTRLEMVERNDLIGKFIRFAASKLGETIGRRQLIPGFLDQHAVMDEQITNEFLMALVELADHKLSSYSEYYPAVKHEKAFIALSRRCAPKVVVEFVKAIPKLWPRQKKDSRFDAVIDAYVQRVGRGDAAAIARDWLSELQKLDHGLTTTHVIVLRALLGRLDPAEADALVRPVLMASDTRPGFASDPPAQKFWGKLRQRGIAPSEWFDFISVSLSKEEKADLAKRVTWAAIQGHAKSSSGDWPLFFVKHVDLPGIVELLSSPLCFAETCAQILDEAGRRADQKFANIWEFVAWAEARHPSLDLRPPPIRE